MILILQKSSGRALGGHLTHGADGLRVLCFLRYRDALVQTLLKVCDARFQLFHAPTLAVYRLE
jgi:hypothetical protein